MTATAFSSAPPTPSTAAAPTSEATVLDRGTVRHDRLYAGRWTVRGISKVAHEATVTLAQLDGTVVVGEGLTAKELTQRGRLDVRGPVVVEGRLRSHGTVDTGAPLRAHDASFVGSIRAAGELTVGATLSVRGQLHTPAVRCERLEVRGSAAVPGAIVATSMEARLDDDSTFGVLQGRDVRLRGPAPNVVRRVLGREACVGGGMNQWREATALWNGPDAHAEFVERTNRDSVDLALALEHDVVRSGYWRYERRPAARLDEYTFRYESDDGARWEVMRCDPQTELYNVVEQSPRPGLQLDDLDAIAERAEERAATYRASSEDFPDVLYALKQVGAQREVRGPGVGTAIPVNEPAWLEAMLLRPDLVGRYLDAQVTTSIKNIEMLAPMGIRLFFGGGDFASNLGPMYSPRAFRDLMLPRLKRISEACHRAGAHHLFGTDGNVWPVAEDLYGNSGIDGHYELDRRAGMDILKIHRLYPRIVMVWNISSHTLHTGSPAQVEAETRACLDEAKQTNKVIAGCSNIIVPETPLQNVEAMLRTIAQHR